MKSSLWFVGAVLVACAAPTKKSGAVLSPAPNPALVIKVDYNQELNGTHTPAGHLYFDLDKDTKADLCVYLWQDKTWTYASSLPESPGFFSEKIAEGKVSEGGVLEGFPASALEPAPLLWTRNVTIWLNDKKVQSHEEKQRQ